MSIKNIEKILSNLIKNGDRETISDIISLLEEVKEYKVDNKDSRTQVKESFQKQIQKPLPKIKGDVNDIIARASMVTEALYENGGPKARPTMPTFNSFQGGGSNSSVDSGDLITSNNPYPVHNDVTSHADALL